MTGIKPPNSVSQHHLVQQMLQPLVHNTDAAPAPKNLFSDNISDMPQVEEEEDQQHQPPPKPAKEWTEAVYTFQDVQTQANLCTWTGAMQKL